MGLGLQVGLISLIALGALAWLAPANATFADLWLTQWPELAGPSGPECHGKVI